MRETVRGYSGVRYMYLRSVGQTTSKLLPVYNAENATSVKLEPPSADTWKKLQLPTPISASIMNELCQ